MAMFIRFCESYSSSFHMRITQKDIFPHRKASLKVDFKCKHSPGKPWHLCVRPFRTQCTCHNPFLSLSNSFFRSSSILLNSWNVSKSEPDLCINPLSFRKQSLLETVQAIITPTKLFLSSPQNFILTSSSLSLSLSLIQYDVKLLNHVISIFYIPCTKNVCVYTSRQ